MNLYHVSLDFINVALLIGAVLLVVLIAKELGFFEPNAPPDAPSEIIESTNYHVSTSFPTTKVLAKATVNVTLKNCTGDECPWK